MLAKVQISMRFHETTMENVSKIILRKLAKEQVLVQKEQLTKNQRNLKNISELLIEWNVTLTINPKWRLINPSKSEIGRISKAY